jgi:hypothetical protein
MTLVAHAPRPGLNLNFTSKNILLALMAVIFATLFVYDGFFAYAARNDAILKFLGNSGKASPQTSLLLTTWKGWNNETDEARDKMDVAIHSDAHLVNIEGWKSPFDVALQKYLAIGLVLVNIWTLWRLFFYWRLRALADDKFLSPAKGLSIPWEKITQVDNTEWNSYGIVKLTYTDDQGKPQRAELDEYKLQKEPLLAILDQLGLKAVNADFIPKTDPQTPPVDPAPQPS